jgi:type IV secretory pathway VirB2 component (pilin)
MTVLVAAFAASSSLADPAGSNALVAAAAWLQGTVLGTVATSVALIAVAGVGLMMLTGRVHLRRGATVIVGCFILFGAPTIAAGLRDAVRARDSDVAALRPAPVEPPLANVPRPTAPSPGYDPYAGASLPPR